MKKPEKMKICSICGKRIPFNSTCNCIKGNRNEYFRKYQKDNAEVFKPLTTERWRKFRIYIINRDGGLCQRCLLKYGILTSSDLEVHHIKPRIKYPELIFDEANCITLCSTCNSQIGIQETLDFEPKKDLNIIDDYHL